MTPRSGWSPANKDSQGRNAPAATSAPPTRAAAATRRSGAFLMRWPWLWITASRAHVEEEVNVGRDVPGDLGAARIGGLQGPHGGEALACDDLVPGRAILHPDDVELPPVPLRLIHDVAVGRERRVLGPGAEDAREVDRGGVVDAMAHDRALQRRLGWPEADGRHHEERRNVPGPRIGGAVGAEFAVGARANGIPVLDRRAAEERLVIEELDGRALEPACREPELGAVHLVLGLFKRRSRKPGMEP